MHRETSQNNHFVALGNKFLRLKFDYILHRVHQVEEIRNFVTSLPVSGKWDVFHLGHFPNNVYGVSSRMIEYRLSEHIDMPAELIVCWLVRS